MYCNFNPNVFKKFISLSKPIIPALSDDWKIIANRSNKLDSVTLESKQLNQVVADIDLDSFLKFIGNENITMKGLLLEGSFIIGNESPGMRKVYTADMFATYNKKSNKNKQKIKANNLVIGSKVELLCGMKGIYVGSCYRVDCKTPKKVHIIRSLNNPKFEYVETKTIKNQGDIILDEYNSRKSYIYALAITYKGMSAYKYNYYSNTKSSNFVKLEFKEYEIDIIIDKYIATSPLLKYLPTKGGIIYENIDAPLDIKKNENNETIIADSFFGRKYNHYFHYYLPEDLAQEFLELGVPKLNKSDLIKN